MTNSTNKLSYYSHQLQSLWEDFDEYIEGGEEDTIVERISELQESIPEIVDKIVDEMDDLEISLVGAKAELKAAKDKYQSRVDLIERQIQSRIDVLVKLHQKDILNDEVIGNTKKITFQLNPPKVELLIDPSSPEFPEEFRETRVEYVALKKQLVEAAKRGKDVSKICRVVRGISPRFKSISGKSGKR